MQSVLIGRNIDLTVRNPNGIVGFQGVCFTCDIDRSAGDLHVVFAGDSVVTGLNIQSSDAIQNQIVLTEDDRICVCVTVRCKCAGHREAVLGVCRCYEYFVSALYIDAGYAVVGDRYAVEDELYFVLITGFDNDGCVRCASGDHIDAFRSDLDRLAVTDSISLCFAQICCLLQVTISEKIGCIDSTSGHHVKFISCGAGF